MVIRRGISLAIANCALDKAGRDAIMMSVGGEGPVALASMLTTLDPETMRYAVSRIPNLSIHESCLDAMRCLFPAFWSCWCAEPSHTFDLSCSASGAAHWRLTVTGAAPCSLRAVGQSSRASSTRCPSVTLSQRGTLRQPSGGTTPCTVRPCYVDLACGSSTFMLCSLIKFFFLIETRHLSSQAGAKVLPVGVLRGLEALRNCEDSSTARYAQAALRSLSGCQV